MLTIREVLAAVRSRHAIPSNYALARFLGVQEKTVARWHTGKNFPDDLMAERLAELAGLDGGEVLASMYAERAQAPEVRAIWAGIADRLKAAGVAALVVVSVSGGPDAGAASTPGAQRVAVGGGLYIM